LIALLFAQDEQDDNDEGLQSDAYQVSDTALEDEQQLAQNVEHIDLMDLEEPTIQDADSYDMDAQDDIFGSISGTTTKYLTLRTKH
jgi:hypothetical protein